MYHLRLKGAHYQMGVRRGRIFQKCGVTFPLHLDRFQLAHGKQSEALLREFFPEVCAEIRGVSDTIGADYDTFAAWMLCMGCCMYNLDANIPVELRGCTAFACVKDGRVLYGRNNDLPPYLKKGSKSELYAPLGGNRFILTTSSFINGEEGLNEHGLAVAMTFVMTPLARIRPGFNSCFIVRYLLEKADSVPCALDLLRELPVASNCNILLADKSGRMVVAECTPATQRIRGPVAFGGDRIVCTVNSFTSAEMKPFDAARGDDYGSERRYQTVMDSFPARFTGAPAAAAERLLRGEYGFMCQYDDPNFETIWSSVFDLRTLQIRRAEGDPRKKRFAPDDRLRHLVFGR